MLGFTSQSQFAEYLGIKQSTYTNYENPDYHPKLLIAGSLVSKGISFDWVLTGRGPMLLEDKPLSSRDAFAIPEQLVVDAVTAVEDWLVAHNRVLPPEKKGQVIAILLEEAMDQGGEQPTIDRAAAGRLLRVAG